MTRLTEDFRVEFEAALAQENILPYNEVLQLCLDAMNEHKLSYVLQNADNSLFLVHAKSRGGLMLSAHNAHRNAEKIYSVGGDKKQLNNAVAIELSPSGANREINLAKNRDLVKRSNGLLAQINGCERFLTVGCGHTAAFCKHAKVGGKTSSKKLQDVHGNIDLHKLFKNAVFKWMVEKGWDWTIVPFEIDEAYPRFAFIAQKALNTSNHVGQLTGELEAAIYLANIVSDPGFKAEVGWEEAAAQQLCELCVPCSSYACTILQFVCDFGGGDDAPQIHFMDAVAKQFVCSNFLGETFWLRIPTKWGLSRFHSLQYLACEGVVF